MITVSQIYKGLAFVVMLFFVSGHQRKAINTPSALLVPFNRKLIFSPIDSLIARQLDTVERIKASVKSDIKVLSVQAK